jgi:hypothetical protein
MIKKIQILDLEFVMKFERTKELGAPEIFYPQA